jgi:hypothetical protein
MTETTTDEATTPTTIGGLHADAVPPGPYAGTEDTPQEGLKRLAESVTSDGPYPWTMWQGCRDRTVRAVGDLALLLGGSDDSWTGDFLRLYAKSDPDNKALLARARPFYCAAWELWQVPTEGDNTYADMAVTLDQLAASLGVAAGVDPDMVPALAPFLARVAAWAASPTDEPRPGVHARLMATIDHSVPVTAMTETTPTGPHIILRVGECVELSLWDDAPARLLAALASSIGAGGIPAAAAP